MNPESPNRRVAYNKVKNNISIQDQIEFFNEMNSQSNSVILEVRELRKSINSMRKITKFKIIIGAAFTSFLITTFLASTTEYEEIILSLLGGIF